MHKWCGLLFRFTHAYMHRNIREKPFSHFACTQNCHCLKKKNCALKIRKLFIFLGCKSFLTKILALLKLFLKLSKYFLRLEKKENT